jgi:hypothetical protein
MVTAPEIGWAPETPQRARLIFGQWPDRMERGRQLFLLALARVLRAEVQALAPTISGMPYAEQLRIGTLGGVSGDAVAIYFEGQLEELTVGERATTLLWVEPSSGDRVAEVLAAWSPWPPLLLPIRPTGARVIARIARSDEVQFYTHHVQRSAGKIEAALAAAGAPGVRVGAAAAEAGPVNRDVGWAVLRSEFGLGDDGAHPHWRPALRAVWRKLPILLRAYVRYVETGREGAFRLPDDDPLGTTDLGSGSVDFTGTIAPFVPSRVPSR